MTGKGIMEALSFVEERYIEEAENGAVPSKRPVVRVLLPLAACLCLILTGLHFLPRQQESQKDFYSAAVQETGYASNVEKQEHKENSLVMESDMFMDEEEAYNTGEAPSLILRIEAWTENGFTAVVDGLVDTDLIPVGTVLQVEMLPEIWVETVIGDLIHVEQRVPTESDYPSGSLVRVMFRFYSEAEKILRIDTICKEDEGK